MSHHVLSRHLSGWGALVGTLVCADCPGREIGQVLRDKSSRDWIATESRVCLATILRRGPRVGRRPNAYLVQALSEATEAQARCRKHGWRAVDLDLVRFAAVAGVTGRPPHVVPVRTA